MLNVYLNTFGQNLWVNRPYIEHLSRFPGSYGVLEPLKFLFKHVSIAYSETDKHCMPRMLTLHFNMFFVVLQVSMFFWHLTLDILNSMSFGMRLAPESCRWWNSSNWNWNPQWWWNSSNKRILIHACRFPWFQTGSKPSEFFLKSALNLSIRRIPEHEKFSTAFLLLHNRTNNHSFWISFQQLGDVFLVYFSLMGDEITGLILIIET